MTPSVKRTTAAPGSSSSRCSGYSLARVDPERNAAHGRVPRPAPGSGRRGTGWPALAHATSRRAGIDDHVEHGDELPELDLVDDHLVRGREEVARLGVVPRQRAERELGHRHVRRGLDPLPGHVAEHDGEPAVVEDEEVVEIAAHVDARRRVVDVAHLEALDGGRLLGEERPLHRLGEVLLLLVEPCVLDRERGLGGDRRRRLDRFGVERTRGVERQER